MTSLDEENFIDEESPDLITIPVVHSPEVSTFSRFNGSMSPTVLRLSNTNVVF